VEVVYGESAPLRRSYSGPDQVFSQGRPGVDSVPRASDRFGSALAVGDFNGDGYDDLAIGSPGERVNGIDGAGGVNILYGSATGLTAKNDQFWTHASPG